MSEHYDNDPKYTQNCVNREIMHLTQRDVIIYWNGDEPEPDHFYLFDVCLNGDSIDVIVEDSEETYDIYEVDAADVFGMIGSARTNAELAAEIVAIVEARIASGQLVDEAVS